ncbi:hypothetical protein [Streptomyces cyanogenus]|uniref:Secreted protein n=1 Tax=Streptomyces cyanogenus TaxID=80860 RepID=A0ABX7TYS9_STRCY|nr:hypothetical protein [Streptomyces cyanogenus]QTE00562.1 hypothetical protein S1361_24740 [Streptomyces cyanogenus]
MEGAAILFVLALAGVASILLFALKGLLDQLPDVIDSARNVRDAWHRFRNRGEEPSRAGEQPPGPNDEESSAAA